MPTHRKRPICGRPGPSAASHHRTWRPEAVFSTVGAAMVPAGLLIGQRRPRSKRKRGEAWRGPRLSPSMPVLLQLQLTTAGCSSCLGMHGLLWWPAGASRAVWLRESGNDTLITAVGQHCAEIPHLGLLLMAGSCCRWFCPSISWLAHPGSAQLTTHAAALSSSTTALLAGGGGCGGNWV